MFALGLAAACVPSARAPQVAATGTLQLGNEQSGPRNDGPFRVVFAGPRGEVAGGAQLSLVFSKPLRALGLAGDETPPAIAIEPALAGQWRWIGTSALAFAPEGGKLPQATQVQVRVPRKLHSLDGAMLSEDFVFEFTTPRPRVAESTPSAGQTGLVPSTTFDLRLNQQVTLAELQKNVSLVASARGKRTLLAFQLEVPDPKAPKHVRLRPQLPLLPGRTIEIVVDPNLRGSEGPLPAGTEQKLSFETYGPLTVSDLDCSRDNSKSRCEPGSGVWLSLSNPVKMRDLKRAVRIEPALPLTWENWRDDDDTTSYIDLNAPFMPGETYTVHVAGSLRDVYGQPLGGAFSQKLSMDDYAPRVEIGVSGQYFEPSNKARIPVASVNVPQYSLWASPLSLADISQHLADNHQDSSKAFESLVAPAHRKSRLIRPSQEKNKPAQESIDPAVVLAAQGGRGPLLIASRFQGKHDVERTMRIIQVTDLGISAKLSRDSTSVVWITALGSGKPVAGAEVSVVGPGIERGASVVTDRDGIATLAPGALGADPRGNADELLVVAKKGGDWSYRTVSDALSSWRASVPTDPFGKPQSYGLLFTERGLYRPGDTVELKGILRREAETGNEILSNRTFTLELRAPNWDVLETYPIKTNAFGTFARKVRIPGSASLGGYRLEIKELSDERGAMTYFEVAEYKPLEMAATVSSDRPSYVRGDRARFTVHGDYLFGAPMGSAPVSFRITRSETSWTLPGLEEVITDATTFDASHPEHAPSSGVIDSSDGKLDAKGAFERPFQLDLAGQRGAELVSFDAEVSDVSRQTVAGSSTTIVHPADFYIGLLPLDPFFIEAGHEFKPRLLVATPNGARIAGQSVRLQLVRRRWTLVRETTGGESHAEMRAVDEPVSSCTTTSTTAFASCALSTQLPGYYLILASAKDKKGRETRAAIDAYALGAGESFWQDDDAQRVELVRDKKFYKPGDIAHVLVKSPFKTADALVTIEGDGVRYQKRMTLSGPTPTIDVPITDAMRPNAYVAVHLVRPRSAAPAAPGRADVGAPTFRTGHVELLVDPEARRLEVGLTPNKTDFKPGEEIDVALSVTDPNGKGAVSEVTVYAVDEGVLSLIGYRTPDPLPVFTAPRPLRTATLESRESLAQVSADLAQILGIGRNKGSEGGGGGEEAGARRDFRQSAYFNPAVMTGADGKARVRFKLPESLTTYRLMAVATSLGDRYGYAEKRVVTSKLLMARPALPRFLRAGDRAEAGLVVSAKNFGPAQVTVKLTAQGLTVSGESTRTIELARDGSSEVRFALVSDKVGAASFRFDVSASSAGQTATDAVVVERRVQSPAVLEAVATYGETAQAAAEQLGDLSSIRRDVGSLELGAASTALVGIDAGFEQLLEYPYGCTEQLTSRLLPLLPLRDLAQSFGTALPKNPEAVIEKTLADLLARQRGDGGFGMWPESSESSLWVSPYALWALHEGKLRGFAVPQSSLDAGRDFLRRKLAEKTEHLGFVSSAFYVDVLALLGAPDAGYMNGLFERRQELPVFARAFLLHAMATGKQPAADVTALSRELENSIRVQGNRADFVENLGSEYAPLMDSPTRTGALVLRALLAADPNHPLASLMARGLLASRDKGAWRSTQETAFALLALDAYQKAQEKIVPSFTARFWQGDKQLFEGQFQGRSTQSLEKLVPTAQLTNERLVFEKKGQGTLFYQARLRYARKELPLDVLDRGFFLSKTLRTVTPAELGAGVGPIPERSISNVPGGSLVLIDLVVVSPSPHSYVVLDDPLPAGLEAVDSGLATSAAWTGISGSNSDAWDPPSDDAVAHGDAFQSSEFRRELRDDRVLFFVDHLPAGIFHYRYLARATTLGRFVLPPTRAEEMYAPEIFGRTGAQFIEVR